MRAHVTLLLAFSILAGAFAGCLAEDETRGDPTISRVHTLTLTQDTMRRAEAAGDDPARALRELLRTELVVRVKEEGDHTLEYTDASGTLQTRAIAGAAPGTPVVVSGVDPLSPAVLKRGDAVVSVRAGISAEWWHAGDLPLGFNMTPSALARYDFTSKATQSLTLRDVDVPDQALRIDELRFDVRVPLEGSVEWELLPDDGSGTPLHLAGEARIARGAGDLVTVDLRATQEGRTGTAGIIGGVDAASMSAEARMWFRDGEPTAAQFLGGRAAATPRAYAWADGPFEDLAGEGGFSCAGRSKADRCSPTELESFDEAIPATDKETIPASDLPRAQTDEEREAIALIQRLFAQDILPGDKASIVLEADSDDFGTSGPGGQGGDLLVEFSIEAIEEEEISVRAGKFRAIQIVEILRTRVHLDRIDDDTGEPVLRDWSMDETVARTTFWLDAKTYQPLLMEASVPIDLDAVLKSFVAAIEPTAWDRNGASRLEPSQWSITAVAESRYEATEIRPATHFSALVGLGVAHSLTGLMGANPLSAAMLGGFAPFGSEMHVEAPVARSLAISSHSPAADGKKSYVVSAASPGFTWADLLLSVDGEQLYFEGWHEECMPPTMGFTACAGDRALGYVDEVSAGDVMSVLAEPGQTLRVIDQWANSVILTVVVH